jgi:hypothetical protein
VSDLSALLRAIVWRRRNAFYAAAVERGIITEVQAEGLMLLHLERDTEQDDRDGGP